MNLFTQKFCWNTVVTFSISKSIQSCPCLSEQGAMKVSFTACPLGFG